MLRLIWHNQPIFQLLGAFVGALLGLSLLMGAVQLYGDAQELLGDEQDLLAPEYIVISKKVSALGLLRSEAPSFSKSEILDLKGQSFIEDISPFIGSQFKVSASIQAGSSFPGMFTELFFEAIPDTYIDVKVEDWKWSLEDIEVPIIVPKDYLNLYNFGFAPSQGLPLVSPKVAGMARFQLNLKGPDRKETYTGRIVGFSDRINSILVPLNFMNYANRAFAKKQKVKPSRLILLTPDPSSIELSRYLSDQGYDTNQDKLKSGRLNSLLKVGMGVLSVLGVLMIGLAFLVFVLSFQLTLSRSSEEIRLLIHLGYPYMRISMVYILFLSGILVAITAFACLLLMYVRTYMVEWLAAQDFQLSGGIKEEVFSIGGIFLLVFILLNSLYIVREVKRLGKS